MRGFAPASVGLGVTLATAFVEALGLSQAQKLVGFSLGVALVAFGIAMGVLGRRRDHIDPPVLGLLKAKLAEGRRLLLLLRQNDPIHAAVFEPEVQDWWGGTIRDLPNVERLRFELAAPWPGGERMAQARLQRVLTNGIACLEELLLGRA